MSAILNGDLLSRRHRRDKKEKIKVVGVEVPGELRLKVTISGLKGAVEEKEIVLRKEGKKEVEEKVLKEIKKRKKRAAVEEFMLPRLLIKLAFLEKKPSLNELLVPPHPPSEDTPYSKIYITKRKEYLVEDPRISNEELMDIEDTLTRLFFLTESDVIAEALSSEASLDRLLAEFGLPPKLRYVIRREIFGYGVLEPLLKDPDLQDIIVPAANIPVKVIHREFGELVTNIMFSESELDIYVEKLVNKANKTVSLYMPMASVQLPEGHRLTVNYKSEITTRGSSIVIRKFPQKPWSIASLLKVNALSPEMAAWLMMLVENKKGILVVGPMGSGKTSVTNALCNFIGRYSTIVTIEDTPELRLAHQYWIQHKTREALTLTGQGNITMFDLVKHALRESADYVIIGEVRGEEGRVWAQALATGHGGITTFHAESHKAAIARLTSPPISVERQMLTALKGIVLTRRFYKKVTEDGTVTWKPIRRVGAIYDLVVHENGEDFTQIFKYDIATDSFLVTTPVDETNTAKELMDELGWSRNTFIEEYNMRVKLFKRLKQHVLEYPDSPLLSYEESTKLIWIFRENPEKAFEYIDSLEGKMSSAEREAREEKKSRRVRKPRIRIIRE